MAFYEDFDKIIFHKIVVPVRKHVCGDAICVEVTEEVNCFIVWMTSFHGRVLVKWFPKSHYPLNCRDIAIEYAVEYGRKIVAEGIDGSKRYADPHTSEEFFKGMRTKMVGCETDPKVNEHDSF